MGFKAVFLDRDGTINIDTDYPKRREDVKLIPGAAQAIARLNRAGLKVVVVSNQSGLARNLFSWDDLDLVRGEVNRQLAAGGARVDKHYECPHHPDGEVKELAKVCDCRKPKPGLVFRAAREMGLDLEGSFMVGDRNSDVLCGLNAGLISIKVLSGKDEPLPDDPATRPHKVMKDLAEAVDWILAGPAGRAA